MFRPAWKPLFVGAIAVAILSGSAMKADAFWWWGGYRPVAYSACYTSCYTVPCYTASYCYDPCGYTSCGYYLGWRPGPVRRLLLGRYRWYYGCSTVPGYCYDSCCGTSMTVTAPAVVSQPAEPKPAQRPEPQPAPTSPPAIPEPTYPMPAIIPQPQSTPAPAVPSPMPAEPAPTSLPGMSDPALPPAAAPGFDFNPLEPTRPSSSYVPKPENSALISVWVPFDAKVIVNGHVTESKGSRRQFVSYGLQPGYSYKYEVKAQLIRDGKILEDVRTVTLTAGQDTSVAFGFQSLPSQALASQW